jgi:hypothetical protein
MRRSVLIATMFAALPNIAAAQEFDLRPPGVIDGAVKDATLIVVGTFRAPWCWPWFDGWHCSGGIGVEEILSGNFRKGGSVPFRWREPFVRGDSGVCYWFTDLRNKRGIWLLTEDIRMPSGWRIQGTIATFCAGPLPIKCKTRVESAIRNARANPEK